MTYSGWDFSSYQGNLPSSGIPGQFAYVKATEGTSYQNPYSVQQVQALRAQGFLVSYYHYLTTDPISDQILNFYNMASSLGETSLPLALDTEVQWSSWQALASAMVDFAQHIEGWTNVMKSPHTLFYVNRNFYDNLAPQGFPWGRWIWLADPSSSPGRPCLVWQTAPRPESWDADNNVDPDTFVGSEQDWAHFTGYTPPPPAPTPTTNTEEEEVEVIWRRNDNGAEYASIGGKVIHLDGDTAQSLLNNGWKVVAISVDAANAAGLTF